MAFSWGAALKSVGKDAPFVGMAIDELLENKRKAARQGVYDERQAEQDERQRLMDLQGMAETGLRLDKLRDEIAMRGKGRELFGQFAGGMERYNKAQAEMMPEPDPERVGPPTREEQGAMNTNELLRRIPKPEITGDMKFYANYEPGLQNFITSGKNRQRRAEDLEFRQARNGYRPKKRNG